MTHTFSRLALALAVVSTTAWIAGCEVDDSLPTRPRTANPLTPNQNAQQNAEHREMEAPPRELPTGGGREFPGQSNAAPVQSEARVLTLQAGAGGAAGAGAAGTTAGSNAMTPTNPNFPISGFYGPPGRQAIGNTVGPVTVYNNSTVSGPIPNLPANPGTTPMQGTMPAPGGDWNVEFSWGQGLVLQDYPHRPWPDVTSTYQDVRVLHNPVYYFNIQDHIQVPQGTGSYTSDVTSSFYEVPWFYLNTAALPVLMVLEPPLALRSTEHPSDDPTFRGHLPATGAVVPAPFPGVLRWTYPFLNPDGTMKPPSELTNPPAPTTRP